jgi:hypothetical protein
MRANPLLSTKHQQSNRHHNLHRNQYHSKPEAKATVREDVDEAAVEVGARIHKGSRVKAKRNQSRRARRLRCRYKLQRMRPQGRRKRRQLPCVEIGVVLAVFASRSSLRRN